MAKLEFDPVPMAELQQIVGAHLEHVKGTPDTWQLRCWLSIAEYLKDAERWHYVRDHDFLDGLSGQRQDGSPESFQKWVDEQLKRQK